MDRQEARAIGNDPPVRPPRPIARPTMMSLGSGLSADPSMKALRAGGEALARAGIKREAGVELSARYGTRVTITASAADLERLDPDRFVEVVDYDPRVNHIAYLGVGEPPPGAALHWLVFRAKAEVNAIVHLRDDAVVEALSRGAEFTTTAGPAPRDALELAMQCLEALRATNYVVTRGHGAMCAGRTVDEVVKTVIGHHQLAAAFLSAP